jgi:hypothetical protein
MPKITDRLLDEDIFEELGIQKFIEVAGKKIGEDLAEKKIKKVLNEFYQFHPEVHGKTNRGDYTYLKNIVERYIYNYTYIY